MLIKAARCSVMISVPQFNGERAQIVENLQELRRVHGLLELLRGDSAEGAADTTLKFDEFGQNDLLEIVERGEHARVDPKRRIHGVGVYQTVLDQWGIPYDQP